MRHLAAIVTTGFVLWAASAEALVVGNPASVIGKGEISLGLESERFEDAFGSDEIQSRRYLAKLTYGLTGHMDLFVKAGSGALNVSPLGLTASSVFEGDARMALGGGARMESDALPSLWNVRLFTALQWLQFDSNGEFLRQQTHKGWTWDERLETSYAWREIGAAFGMVRSFEKLSVYSGLAFTRISGTVDREQYVLSGDTSVKVGEGQQTFSEGPGVGLFLGVDVPLSGTLRMSSEYQMNGGDRASFFIGVSEKMD